MADTDSNDPFDMDALLIDPADLSVASGATKGRKAMWERKFVHFPWLSIERLQGNQARRRLR
jgi:hypothetical protein